jgi:hypothetical protein
MNFDHTFQTKPASETMAEQMLITKAQSAIVIQPLSEPPSVEFLDLHPAARPTTSPTVFAKVAGRDLILQPQ